MPDPDGFWREDLARDDKKIATHTMIKEVNMSGLYRALWEQGAGVQKE